MERNKKDILHDIAELRLKRSDEMHEIELERNKIFNKYEEPLNKLHQELLHASELIGKYYKHTDEEGMVTIGLIKDLVRYRQEELKIEGPTFMYQIPEMADGYCEISGFEKESYRNIVIKEGDLSNNSKLQIISEEEAKKLIERYTEDTLKRILKMFG